MPYRHIRKHMRQMIGDSPKDAEDIEKGDNAKGTYCTCVIPRGRSGGRGCPLLLDFFYKNEVLNEYRIYLKMLEMAVLKTQIFKNFWGSMTPNPPTKLAPLVLIIPPPLLFLKVLTMWN